MYNCLHTEKIIISIYRRKEQKDRETAKEEIGHRPISIISQLYRSNYILYVRMYTLEDFSLFRWQATYYF